MFSSAYVLVYFRLAVFEPDDQCFTTFPSDSLTVPLPNNSYQIYYTPVNDDTGMWYSLRRCIYYYYCISFPTSLGYVNYIHACIYNMYMYITKIWLLYDVGYAIYRLNTREVNHVWNINVALLITLYMYMEGHVAFYVLWPG